jgi:hypothetical protein
LAGDSPSAECIIKGGGDDDMGVLENWIIDLGAGWISRLPDGASAERIDYSPFAQSWIQVLPKITDTICLMTPSFPGRAASISMLSISGEGPETETNQRGDEASIPDQLQFAKFIKETMMKMLAFVDFLGNQAVLRSGAPIPDMKEDLSILLRVRSALSKALSEIRLLFHSPTSAQVERMQGEIISLLSAKEAKVDEIIWSGMERIMIYVLQSI